MELKLRVVIIFEILISSMKNNFIFWILTLGSISLQGQNKENLWVLKPNYLFIEVDEFSNNIARVRLYDGWHFLKKGDSLPSKDIYKESYNYYNGFACVFKKNKKYQFRDILGNFLPQTYEDARSFCSGLAAVKQKDKWGFMDTTGKKVIGFKYDDAGFFANGKASVQYRNKELIIDETGTEIVTDYRFIAPYSERLAWVRNDRHDIGYIDTDGNEVIPCYEGRKYGSNFSGGLAAVVDTMPNLSYIDKDGHVIFWFKKGAFKSDANLAENIHLHRFSEGLAAVRKEGAWGFINHKGNWAVEPTLQKVTPFSEGLAAVKKDRYWVFVDENGHVVVEGDFIDAKPYSDGVAWVKTINGWGLVKNPLLLLPQLTLQSPPVKNVEVNEPNQTIQFYVSSETDLLKVEIYQKDRKIRERDMRGAKVAANKKKMRVVNYQIEEKIYLDIGENKIFIRVTNKVGKATEMFQLTYQPFDSTHNNSNRNYHALLIANQNYKHLDALNKPIEDATELTDVLVRNYGFNPSNVQLKTDLTHDQMKKSFADLENLAEKDYLLIFYAGHGTVDSSNTQNRIAYWVPVDAEDALKWLSASTITDYIKRCKAKHILLITDACYSGIMTYRNAPSQTAREQRQVCNLLESLQSRHIMSSGHQVPVPDDSVFLHHFLDKLKHNNQVCISAEELYNAVKPIVINNSGIIPQYSTIRDTSHDGGDFIFYRVR